MDNTFALEVLLVSPLGVVVFSPFLSTIRFLYYLVYTIIIGFWRYDTVPTLQVYLRDDLYEKWILQGGDIESLRKFMRDSLEKEVTKR